MGMFDSVIVRCSACGQKIEFQSKAGRCDLKEYTVHNVPDVIALDLIGEQEQCGNCSNWTTLAAPAKLSVMDVCIDYPDEDDPASYSVKKSAGADTRL